MKIRSALTVLMMMSSIQMASNWAFAAEDSNGYQKATESIEVVAPAQGNRGAQAPVSRGNPQGNHTAPAQGNRGNQGNHTAPVQGNRGNQGNQGRPDNRGNQGNQGRPDNRGDQGRRIVHEGPRRDYEPGRMHGGIAPWSRWENRPYYVRPIYNFRWNELRIMTCTAVDSYGDRFPVTEDGYIGDVYERNLSEIEDSALDRCYSQSGGDNTCRLLNCEPGY